MLNIGGSSTLKAYAKYNSKADKWFIRGDGGDVEIARPTFLADLGNIATGWLRFREGEAPERLIDPALDRAAPSPGEGFKRGFVLGVYSKNFFGGAVELSSGSIHMGNSIREVYRAFEEQRVAHAGMLPVIVCTGSEAMKDKHGVNYRPKFELVKWAPRPAELPDASPVEAHEVWVAAPLAQGAPAAPRPAATHVPPPGRSPGQAPAAKPAPDPMTQTEF